MVKWLSRIILSDKESENYYHLHDNKVLPVAIGNEIPVSLDIWNKTPESTIYEMNINSVFFEPKHKEVLLIGPNMNINKMYTLTGYAYSGGGRPIVRVEVTFDKGKSWNQCDLKYYQPYKSEIEMISTFSKTSYSWVHFQLAIQSYCFLSCREFSVKATDISFNTQPKDPTWNLKGMMNNSWYTIKTEILTKNNDINVVFYHPVSPGIIDPTIDGWKVTSTGKYLEIPRKLPIKNLSYFSIDEVQKHNKEDDCWIILNKNEIYNVTSYLRDHPGGKSAILLFGGKDATQLFNGIHSDTAQKIKDLYLIGYLVQNSTNQSLKPKY